MMSTRKDTKNRSSADHAPISRYAGRVCMLLVSLTSAVWPYPAAGQALPAQTHEQLRLLHDEKASRTPAEKRLDSQLLYGLRRQRTGTAVPGLPALNPALSFEPDGRVLVDIDATVTEPLLNFIRRNGGVVVSSFPKYNAIRALVTLDSLDTLAAQPFVRFVRPADRATTNASTYAFQGDVAHLAAAARTAFFTDGAGIKIGVLSDSVDYLATAQNTGFLPPVTVLPGQAGSGFGEGTAMLEIVHSLAPGADLYFATAFNGIPSFADNIRALQAAGCRIIVDDVLYFRESPFQDGPIAQAVNDVSAAGTLFFSSAANGGGLDRGTSGTWEGDFHDGGPATVGRGGRLHDFGGATFNTVIPGGTSQRVDMFWADPLGASTNDYDVYLVDTNGAVIRSSTNVQQGNGDPYESIPQLSVGDRIVIVKYSGDDRYLHLDTLRGRLQFATSGSTHGHNASGAPNAFSVAATPVANPPAPFVGGNANAVEYFSSDGPRRVFFNPDGSAITPGDFSTSGGRLLPKPDITAADGVNTTVPGFAPFFGTSAAAPHAAAVAALVWSYNPFLAPEQMRTILTGTALDIAAPGLDQDSGAGIVMALPALGATPQSMLQQVQLLDANGNGGLDQNECADLTVTLQNETGQPLTGISAVLGCAYPGVVIDPAPRTFPDLAVNQSATSNIPFRISTTSSFVCGSNITFVLHVSSADLQPFDQYFSLSSGSAGAGGAATFAPADLPAAIPDVGMVESAVVVHDINLPLAAVRVSVYITHTYDSDLRISLLGPDGTKVVLSDSHGQSGQNYGAGCDNMTVFSDTATNSIANGNAPFLGVFTPDQPLSVFTTKFGSQVNGTWTLRVEDLSAEDTGTLQCWSLDVVPIACFDGGGQCLVGPSITQSPTNALAPEGGTAQFALTVQGTAPLAFQWQFSGTNLPGATDAMLTLSNLTLAQAGPYTVVVTNAFGSVISASAQLTVVVPPTLVCGTNRSVEFGSAWDFDAPTATGDGAVVTLLDTLTNTACGQTFNATRHWVVTDTNGFQAACSQTIQVVDTTAPVLSCPADLRVVYGTTWDFGTPLAQDVGGVATLQVVSTITNTDCGKAFTATRTWRATDACGNFATCSQTVQVQDQGVPDLIAQPQDLAVLEGTNASLTVIVSSCPPLAYQWFFNQTNALLDATNAVLEFTNVSPSQAGLYFVVITNGYGSITSSLATLTVLMPPTILSGPADQVATNGDAVQLRVLAQGTEPLVYQWYFNETNLLADATNSTLELTNVSPLQAGTYAVVITNLYGSVTNGGVVLAVVVPAALLSGPTDLVVTNGDTAQFSVTTAGTEPLAYQWYFNGTNVVPGATGPSLVFTNVSRAEAGLYSVLVTNSYGSMASPLARLTVVVLPTLVCSSNRTIELGSAWDFDAPAATGDGAVVTVLDTLTNATCGETLSATRNWVVTDTNGFQAACSQTIQVVDTTAPILTCPPDLSVVYGTNWNFGTPLAQDAGVLEALVYDNWTNNLGLQLEPGSVEVGNQITLSGNARYLSRLAFGYWATNSQQAELQSSAFVNVRFYLNDGSNASPQTLFYDSGPLAINAATQATVVLQEFQLSAAAPLTNPLPESFTWTVQFSGLSSNETAGLNWYGPPVIGQLAQGYWTNSPDGWGLVSDAPGGFGGQLGGVSREVNLEVVSTVTNADCGQAFTATRTWRAADACGNFATCAQTVQVQDQGGPELTAQPQDLAVLEGQNGSLSVTVASCPPLGFQWYFNQTNALLDATNAVLELTNVNPAQAGLYSVVITNGYGSLTSTLANLTVLMPPSILSGPADQVATNGDTVVLGVLAQGTDPLAYQWFFNETNLLADATNSTLALTNVTPDQAGAYAVVVTNAYGTLTSSPALLTVVLPAALLSGPADLTITNGQTAQFSVAAQGTEPFGFQWYFNETNLLAGATGTALVLPNISRADEGLYSVVMTNAYGSVTSAPARLTVILLPSLTCGSNLVVELGSPWDFETPAATGDGAVLSVLETITNAGCGATFTATRTWLVTDTNGFQASCSQIVQVVDTTAPVLSCPTDLTVVSGSNWTFSTPLAQDAGVAESMVYDNWTNPAGQFNAGSLEVGNQITLSGSDRFLSQLAFDYWASNSQQPELQGPAALDVRFYLNDGPAGSPQTLFYDSGPLAIMATTQATIVLQDFQLTALVPLTNALPDTFTWTVQFSGLSTAETAGLSWYGPPVVGQLAGGYWTNGAAGSGLVTDSPGGFGAQILAVPRGVTVDVVSTVTNIDCGNAFTATRTWQATDLCGNQASCSQTVQVQDQGQPTVSAQPLDQAVLEGQNASLTVAVASCPPLGYQWYFNETNLLAGATNANLDLGSVTAAQAGLYMVVITNAYGSVTSSPAFLAVLLPPLVVAGPGDQLVTNGNTVQFEVLAQGTGPLSFQWYFNETNLIADATNATLELTNVTPAETGWYLAVVTNAYGSTTSSPVLLTVVEPVTLLSGPAGLVTTNGLAAQFSVAAQGTDPLFYQWYFNETNLLAGETNATLLLANVTPLQAGLYSAVVTNAYGSVTSPPAQLAVIVLPTVLCGTNRTVEVGAAWDFDSPAVTGNGVALTVLDTVTNAGCGDAFTATRTWLVSDTNGYQASCSQSIQVVDTTPPALSCPADQTVVYGVSWQFGTPLARDTAAVEALVYDNWTNGPTASFAPGATEVGNQVTLAGTERYLSRLAFDYWGTNSQQTNFEGEVALKVRFYLNDGLDGSPQTLFYDSGPLAVMATTQATMVLQEFQLTAALPLTNALPESFTWTVQFSGLTSNDSAGLLLYGPPVAGEALTGYWTNGSQGWAIVNDGTGNFGAQLSALSRGVTLEVVDTVTNADCGNGFTATRTWQATDACGNRANCMQTVSVADQGSPVILAPPQDQAVLEGQSALFAIAVSSCPPLVFQWYFNDTNLLADATNATLELTNISAAQAGVYAVVVSNNFGSLTSSPALLNVLLPPTLVSQPADVLATNGDAVELSAVAQGTTPLVYQWYFNDTNLLADATNATLQLTNVSPTDAGLYAVVITNAYGAATSSPARLTVVVPAVILSGPANVIVTNGQTAEFGVLADGTPPLTYQWYFNDTPLPDETNSTLVLSNATRAQAGLYSVVVSNAYATVTSASAELFVVVLPTLACSGNRIVELGNAWDFDAPAATGDGAVVTVLDTLTNTGCGETFSATRNWVVTDTNGFQAACSQTIQVVDTTAPVLSGPPDLAVVYGTNWNFGTPLTQDAGVAEALIYDNWTNNLGVQLDAGSLEVGNQITLSGSDRYLSRLSFDYWATNSQYAELEGPAAVEVRFYLNDGPGASPQTLFYDSGRVAINATTQATVMLQEFQLSASVPLTNSLPESFTWSVQFSGLSSNETAGLNWYGPPVIGQGAQGYWTNGSSGWGLVSDAPGAFGAQFTGVSRSVSLEVVSTVTNVDCGHAFTAIRTWRATDACGNSATCAQTVQVQDHGGPDITAPPQDLAVLEGQNGVLSVTVPSCPPLGYQWYFNQTNALLDATNAVLELTHINPAQAGVYSVVITNGYGSITSRLATVTVLMAPSILSGPLDLVATNGDTVQLAVVAQGTDPLGYQWYFNETNLLADATNSTLELSNVSPDQAGSYAVAVTNAYGSLTSSPAILSVWVAPVIVTQPTNQSVPVGGTAIFAVSATGIPAPAYQWLLNETNVLSAETNATLVLLNVQTSNEGQYSVRVSNAAGSVVSTQAALTVLTPPNIVGQPQSITTFEGETIFISVTVLGQPPFSYQWYADCTRPISGSTASTLRLKNVTPADSGTYCVTVSNEFGTTLSQPATVRVLVQPSLISLKQNQQGVALTFSTVSNLLYTVYYSDDLDPAQKTLLPEASQLVGTGNPMTVLDATAGTAHRFYWLKVE